MTDWKTDAEAGTPGPWRLEVNTTLVWGNCDPDLTSWGMGKPCASAVVDHGWQNRNRIDEDEAEANARRISRVPAYEEALRAAEDLFDSLYVDEGEPAFRDAFREAMKKL